MQLRQALEIINQPRNAEGPFPVLLACGFTPLHLETFLAAHLQQLRPRNRVEIRTGVYDQLLSTLTSLDNPSRAPYQGVFVTLEWPDLDPRLGLRQLGGWSPAKLPEIVESAKYRLGLLESALEPLLAAGTPLVLSGPLLEMPPIFPSFRRQLHPSAADLQAVLAAFLGRVSSAGAKILNSSCLPDSEPRFDLNGYLSNGFPYRPAFAAALASQLSHLLLPPPPKKGLITDLDDTLWKGILGEVGAENVHWDLQGKAQLHGIYQSLLQSLAEAGVLVAVASKNDPQNVQAVFSRKDILLLAQSVFPLEAGWGPKSNSVSRILKAWNIGEDAVVFVDDSPMELAEVAVQFPGITTLQFSSKAAGFWELAGFLRDAFGTTIRISEEDRIRSASLRAAQDRDQARTSSGGGRSQDNLDAFLAQSEAVITLEPVDTKDQRPLELVNKTNQFNLNGKRRTEVEWRGMLNGPDAVSLIVSYEDKYGPLGKIAVLAGEQRGQTLHLHTWVMSCRAFSRRIEFQCLRYLFEEFGVLGMELDLENTAKNGPVREFLAGISAGPGLITADSFTAGCPDLPHIVHSSPKAVP